MAEETYDGPNTQQAEAVAGNTRLVAQMVAEQTGEDGAPGRAGVEYLDGFINRQREREDCPAERLADMLGCYLGEALIAEAGGRWIQHPEYGLGVELAPKVVVFPFSKTGKQFRHGREDSILSLFDIATDLAKQRHGGPSPVGT